jgi:hypothetical protein
MKCNPWCLMLAGPQTNYCDQDNEIHVSMKEETFFQVRSEFRLNKLPSIPPDVS